MLQVIGDPIFHSKSPIIQTTMLDYLGLDIPYTPQLVKKGEVAQYLDYALAHGVTGFNATMPHKEELVGLMDELDEDARLFGAVNTVCLRDGKAWGYNTDGAGFLRTLDDEGISPAGKRVLVLGAGPTGLCTMMCARLYRPAHILAVEPEPARRALALAQGWADEAVEPGPRAAEVLKSWTDGRGADVVLEAAGGRDTFQTAWQLARPNATVTVVAMYEEPQVLPLPDMYGKNLTFKTGGVDACHCGEILELIAAGKLNAEPLITHTYPLERVMEAYDLFEQKGDGGLKIAVQP